MKNPVASILVLIGGLAYFWVVWSAWAWAASTFVGNSTNLMNLTSVIWALLFGVATTGAIGLIFMSLGSFMGGWMEEMQAGAKMAVRASGIALFALSFAGGFSWFIATAVGFVLVWMGLAMTMM